MSSMTFSRKRARKFTVAAMALAIASGTFAMNGDGPRWRMIGNDSRNSRNQPFEHKIGVENARRLELKWKAPTAGDVSGTPAVADGAVYFGDFGGMEWKLSAETGDVIWSHNISDYTGIGGDISRTSPTLVDDTLVIGDLSAPNIMGIDAKSGDLRWIARLLYRESAAGRPAQV
jgi:polyvinyl alcohol dehydrogenase (cytochrome)